jgi:hypothetical protein
VLPTGASQSISAMSVALFCTPKVHAGQASGNFEVAPADGFFVYRCVCNPLILLGGILRRKQVNPLKFLVKQGNHNPLVGGSNPSAATIPIAFLACFHGFPPGIPGNYATESADLAVPTQPPQPCDAGILCLYGAYGNRATARVRRHG